MQSSNKVDNHSDEDADIEVNVNVSVASILIPLQNAQGEEGENSSQIPGGSKDPRSDDDNEAEEEEYSSDSQEGGDEGKRTKLTNEELLAQFEAETKANRPATQKFWEDEFQPLEIQTKQEFTAHKLVEDVKLANMV